MQTKYIPFVGGFFIGVLIVTLSNKMFVPNSLNQLNKRSRNQPPVSITTNPRATTVQQTSSSRTEDDIFMSLMQYIQKERLVTQKETCSKILKEKCFSAQNEQNFPNHLHSKKHKFALCGHNTSDGSNWLRAIMIMEGYYNRSDLKTAETKEGKFITETDALIGSSAMLFDTEKDWTGYRKVLTVRNPFEFLVSAYTDKLIPSGKGYSKYYQDISKKMNKMYKFKRHKKEDEDQINQDWATFEDFLNSLLEGGYADDSHWGSYSVVCKPCSFMYNHIVKFETFSDDVKYLSSILNMTEADKSAFFSHLGIFRISDADVKDYFAKIPKPLAFNIYQMYRNDFVMFGYEFPSWLC